MSLTGCFQQLFLFHSNSCRTWSNHMGLWMCLSCNISEALGSVQAFPLFWEESHRYLFQTLSLLYLTASSWHLGLSLLGSRLHQHSVAAARKVSGQFHLSLAARFLQRPAEALSSSLAAVWHRHMLLFLCADFCWSQVHVTHAEWWHFQECTCNLFCPPNRWLLDLKIL